MITATAKDSVVQALETFIRDPEFPCVGAKSAVQRQQMTVYVADNLRENTRDEAITTRLQNFVALYDEQAVFMSILRRIEGF